MSEPMSEGRLEELVELFERAYAEDTCLCWDPDAADKWPALRGAIDRLRAENAELRVAIKADDERLRAAEERVWPGKTWGCDAPEMLAEAVLGLRLMRDELKARLEALREVAEHTHAVGKETAALCAALAREKELSK